MLVSSIQKNNLSPNFNGLLTIKDIAAGKTKVFKISAKGDRQLYELYKQIHRPVAKTTEGKIANINNYINAIFNITKDEFVNNLPRLTKEDKVKKVADLSSKSLYSSFMAGEYYTDIETTKFKISHDVRI